MIRFTDSGSHARERKDRHAPIGFPLSKENEKVGTYLKKSIEAALKAVGNDSALDEVWNRYKGGTSIRDSFVLACGYDNLDNEAVEAESEAAVAAEALRVAKEADKPKLAGEVVKANAKAAAARKAADEAMNETEKFLQALKAEQPPQTGSVVSPEDNAKQLRVVKERAEQAREAAKNSAENAKELARQAAKSANKAKKLSKRASETKDARAAADRATEAAEKGAPPNNAAHQLNLATAAMDAVRGIVRANGDASKAEKGAIDAEAARDLAKSFEEEAKKAANDAAKALEDLQERIGGGILIRLKAEPVALGALIAALVATSIAWFFGLPFTVVIVMAVAVVGVGLWAAYSKGEPNPATRPAVMLAVGAVVVAFLYYGNVLGAGDSNGTSASNPGSNLTEESVDCWLAKYQDHPDCQ